jgi:hypothetical protein
MFLRCLSGKLLAYGLHRKPRDSDAAVLDAIVARLGDRPWSFVNVVQQIAASRPFQYGIVESWAELR